MKSIRYSIIITLLILISSNCSEDRYLDIYPETSITQGNFYQDETQLKQALNDAYRQLTIIYNPHGVPCLYAGQSSDDVCIIAKGSGDNYTEQIVEHVILPNNGRILDAWRDCYNAIYICNVIIHQLEITEVSLDANLKSRMMAEAILIRSLLYFNMVRAWGDIPLITEPISPIEAYDYLRESTENVYQQIIDDLNMAKTNLPESYSGEDVGRVTKYAAAGILAKVHLTLGNTALAKAELEFIINSNKFTLDADQNSVVDMDDYLYIFHPDTKNCKSSILEVQYKSGPNAVNSSHQITYAPFSRSFNLVDLGVPLSSFAGRGESTPTQDLIDEFEVDDPRHEASIFPGFTDLDTDIFTEWPFTIKYFDPDYNNPGSNVKVIRYADVLLMYAEVTQDANYLNMVRNRAGLPHFGTVDYPSTLYPTLDLAIEHERRVELSFEFHRFFDLVRTNRAIAVLQSKGYDIDASDLLFPIPQAEIDINPNLTQNSGY